MLSEFWLLHNLFYRMRRQLNTLIIHPPKPSGKLALLGRAKRWHKLKPSPATRVVCPAFVVYLASLKTCHLRCTPWSLCGASRAAETPGKGCKGCMAKYHLATTSILVITKTLSPRLKIFGNPWAFMATPLEYAWQASMTDLRREVHGNFLIARALCTGSKATLAPDISPQRNVPWWSPMSISLPSVIPWWPSPNMDWWCCSTALPNLWRAHCKPLGMWICGPAFPKGRQQNCLWGLIPMSFSHSDAWYHSWNQTPDQERFQNSFQNLSLKSSECYRSKKRQIHHLDLLPAFVCFMTFPARLDFANSHVGGPAFFFRCAWVFPTFISSGG